jgi:REP element-mobilizing transposase RayT
MKQRKPNRLKDYDYSQNGYYFVTICTKDKEEYFGKVENGKMILNKIGEIARNLWKEIPNHFNDISLDEYTVMPNHVHGIVIIVRNADLRSLHQKRTKMLLSTAIQQYKSSVTREANSLRMNVKFQWHKSFHDHIIRDEKALNNIREYIANNPLKWESDVENKINSGKDKKDYYRKIIKGS